MGVVPRPLRENRSPHFECKALSLIAKPFARFSKFFIGKDSLEIEIRKTCLYDNLLQQLTHWWQLMIPYEEHDISGYENRIDLWRF